MATASYPADHYDTVDLGEQRQRIRNGRKGWTVDDDEIVFRSGACQHRIDCMPFEQLSWVRRQHTTGCEEVQRSPRTSFAWSRAQVESMQGLVHWHGADQHIGQAGSRFDVELLRERRLAEVDLQKQHPRSESRDGTAR